MIADSLFDISTLLDNHRTITFGTSTVKSSFDSFDSSDEMVVADINVVLDFDLANNDATFVANARNAFDFDNFNSNFVSNSCSFVVSLLECIHEFDHMVPDT